MDNKRCISVRRGIGPTPTRVRVGGLPEGRAYSAGIETFDIVGAERGEVSPEVFFTMAPPEAAAPKIAIGLLNVITYECYSNISGQIFCQEWHDLISKAAIVHSKKFFKLCRRTNTY